VKVLSHRGHWLTAAEKNGETAFRRSFDGGWGTETDVRDCAGRLVISHDMPGGGEMGLDDFLALHAGRDLPLAVNVKADGLAQPLQDAMRRHRVPDWFAFDMSVPDMRAHLRIGSPVFTRLSEVERRPVWLEQACGVWLDGFEGTWFGATDIRDLLRAGKRVCVVSPELHGRDPGPTWQALRPLAAEAALMLCTDRPPEAAALFGPAVPQSLARVEPAPALI
jgi:hypothetical protein